MFGFLKRKEEDEGVLRDYKSVLEELGRLKEEDLGTIADDKSEQAMLWYEQYAVDAYKEITRSDVNDRKVKKQMLVNSVQDYYTPAQRIGMMFTFHYEPETPGLDYWDKFPLIIKMAEENEREESFLGMNLHYLFPKFRRMVLIFLMTRMTRGENDPESRIAAMTMTKLLRFPAKYGRAGIRRYLYKNIKGRVIRIPPEHWLKVIYLPTHQFVGGRPAKIWLDSYNKIRKLGNR